MNNWINTGLPITITECVRNNLFNKTNFLQEKNARDEKINEKKKSPTKQKIRKNILNIKS